MSDNLEALSLEEEKELIDRAKVDGEAFGELYTLYFQKIYNYLLHRTGDVSLTEDLTSQVFMKVLDNISKFEWRGLPFSAWLYRIASNILMTYYRKNKRSSNVNIEDIEFLIIDDSMSALDTMKYEDEQIALKEQFERVRKALEKLKPKYAEIIQYKYFEKMENSEIAKIIGVSEGNLRIRLYRALKKLKEIL